MSLVQLVLTHQPHYAALISNAPSPFSCQPSTHYFPQPSLNRSSTFPRCRHALARERIHQIAGHLSQTNTLASESQNSKRQKMAHDTAPQSQPASTNKQTPPTPQKNCESCGQDLKFKARPKTNDARLKNIDDEVPDVENQLVGVEHAIPAVPHKDFIHCMPPTEPTYRKFSIFTAGSIEMGAAVQWQKLLASHVSDLPITVLNPRRGNWDPTDIPKAHNQGFKSQVEWELAALERADLICFFFDVTTRSPITLLELGLWAASKKVIVCCSDKYWRSGNVEIVCKRYGIPFVREFKDFVPAVRTWLTDRMDLDANGDIKGPNVRDQDEKISSPLDFNAHPPLPSN